MALATPFGNYFSESTMSSVDGLDSSAQNNLNGVVFAFKGWTNYSPEEIEAYPTLHGIGSTSPEYVVADFNEDGTEVTITCNSINSDGIIADYSIRENEGLSPMAASQTLKTVNFDSDIVNIGNALFYNCSELETVTMTDDITKIGDNSFTNCISLKLDTLPSSLKTIGTSAFRNCTKIKAMIIPASVENIGSNALGYPTWNTAGKYYYTYSFTIYGTPGSYAETYANSLSHITFIAAQFFIYKKNFIINNSYYLYTFFKGESIYEKKY